MWMKNSLYQAVQDCILHDQTLGPGCHILIQWQWQQMKFNFIIIHLWLKIDKYNEQKYIILTKTGNEAGWQKEFPHHVPLLYFGCHEYILVFIQMNSNHKREPRFTSFARHKNCWWFSFRPRVFWAPEMAMAHVFHVWNTVRQFIFISQSWEVIKHCTRENLFAWQLWLSIADILKAVKATFCAVCFY